MLRELCHALSGDFGSVFVGREDGGETEPSGKENGEEEAIPSSARGNSSDDPFLSRP